MNIIKTENEISVEFNMEEFYALKGPTVGAPAFYAKLAEAGMDLDQPIDKTSDPKTGNSIYSQKIEHKEPEMVEDNEGPEVDDDDAESAEDLPTVAIADLKQKVKGKTKKAKKGKKNV